MTILQPALSDLENMARQAGAILRAGYGKRHDITHKGAIDLVTDTDHLSEDLLVSTIQTKFPGHHIVTEEAGILAGDLEHCWYIDPLDGTVNFAHDVPLFCVTLAYAFRGEMQLGVIYEPMRDECYTAERGKGAWMNGEAIHVSTTPDLLHSLLVTGFPYDMWSTSLNNLKYFTHFSLCSQGVRRLGSAALDLAYIAAGRLDGFWEITLRPWDIAAGGLLVREAGGVVTRMDGSPDILQSPISILAGNPVIHPLMLPIFQNDHLLIKY